MERSITAERLVAELETFSRWNWRLPYAITHLRKVEVLRQPVESVQYLSLAYTDRLAELGIAPSVGSRGDSYDNAPGEAVNAAYKTELINRGKPRRCIDDVELATANEWPGTARNAGTKPSATFHPPSTRPP